MAPRLGILILLATSVVLGAGHVSARVAIEHGASVTAAAGVRSAFTAVFVLVLIRAAGVSLEVPAGYLRRLPVLGALVALQSYCLFSAVIRIPVALALLVFQSFPALYMLLSWAMGKERPPRIAIVATPIALAGLALALDVLGSTARMSQRWSELGEGCAWAFGASIAFSAVMYMNTHWVKGMDGRVRTFFVMIVTAALLLGGGAAAGALSLPVDRTGWIALVVVAFLYGIAITSMFVIVPKLAASSSVALNFEPIAALAIAWVVLDQAISATQILGALIVVSAIASLGLAKR